MGWFDNETDATDFFDSPGVGVTIRNGKTLIGPAPERSPLETPGQWSDRIYDTPVRMAPEPVLSAPPEDSSWTDFFKGAIGKRMYETVPPYAYVGGASNFERFISGEKRDIDLSDPREQPYQMLTGQPLDDPNDFWKRTGPSSLTMTTNNPARSEIVTNENWNSVLGVYNRDPVPGGYRYQDIFDIAPNINEVTEYTGQFDYYTNPRTIMQRELISMFLDPVEITGVVQQ